MPQKIIRPTTRNRQKGVSPEDKQIPAIYQRIRVPRTDRHDESDLITVDSSKLKVSLHIFLKDTANIQGGYTLTMFLL